MWSDGASTGKRGAGGWAYLVEDDKQVYWDSGGISRDTTNSRTELLAVIYGLDAISDNHGPEKVQVYCDSAMVVNGIRRDWISLWRGKNWKTSRGKDVANQDLWLELERAIEQHHHVEMTKVKGHTKSSSKAAIGNRRVDSLCHAACQNAKSP